MSSSTQDLRRKEGCPASPSLRKALKDAFTIVCLEFMVQGDFSLAGCDCASIRKSWEDMWPALLQQKKSERSRKRLASALRSTRRLFDRSCRPCDMVNEGVCKTEWIRHMEMSPKTAPATWAPDPLGLLSIHIKELIGGWRRREPSEEGWGDEYCPDQQGCFEVKMGRGGTLACSSDKESLDDSLLRLGVAKTKGKSRVVTMQPARVKRILSPIHNSLYNHLSRYGWLVRGDFTKEDAETIIQDRKPGEQFVSGDYSSATNELHQDAVKTVVSAICDSPAVLPDEKRVLWSSFQRLRVKTGVDVWDVNRGSMMGNLVSFPILCLINKACYDITCDIIHGPLSGRKGKFNGDDCLFNGSKQFYDTWNTVTSTFGLKVNHEKTGVSDRWLELNSKSYDAYRHRFVSKPVLSFLLRERDSREDLISQILDGISSFKDSVKEYTLNVLMRRDVSLRVINLSALPLRWLKRLIKRSWFRNALTRGPAPLKERGTRREVEMVIDRPPRPRFYDLFDRMGEDLRSEYIERWKGVEVRPHEEWFSRTGIRRWWDQTPEPLMPRFRLNLGPKVWRFVWPKDLRDFLIDKGYFDIVTVSEAECLSDWIDDHKSLHPVYLHTFTIPPRLFRQPSELDFLSQFPLGHR
nr:MAG: hypothetical protein [Botourmiaviridae sp.]